VTLSTFRAGEPLALLRGREMGDIPMVLKRKNLMAP
jgi:hypothetical protein